MNAGVLERTLTATSQELASIKTHGHFAMETVNMDKAQASETDNNDAQIIVYTEKKVSWKKAVELMRQALEDGRGLIGLIAINAKREVLLSIGDEHYKNGHDGLVGFIGRRRNTWWKTDFAYLMKSYNESTKATVFDLVPPIGNWGQYTIYYYQFHGLSQNKFKSSEDRHRIKRDEMILIARLIQEAASHLSASKSELYQDMRIGALG